MIKNFQYFTINNRSIAINFIKINDGGLFFIIFGIKGIILCGVWERIFGVTFLV